jgi:DNA-binding PadR family transcriptional regulator
MFSFRSGIKTSKGGISPVQFLILLTLARKEKGIHGYAILRLMKCGFHGKWIPKSGTLYPALDRLVDNGFVEKQEIKETESLISTKDRTYRYTLTNEGKNVVNEVLEKFPDSFRGPSPFWHYVMRHAPQKFQQSKNWRLHLISRLLPGHVLTEHFSIENEQNTDDELRWLETYKQKLQEELEKIDNKLKKIKEEK